LLLSFMNHNYFMSCFWIWLIHSPLDSAWCETLFLVFSVSDLVVFVW
jgi:hypothetical protein